MKLSNAGPVTGPIAVRSRWAALSVLDGANLARLGVRVRLPSTATADASAGVVRPPILCAAGIDSVGG